MLARIAFPVAVPAMLFGSFTFAVSAYAQEVASNRSEVSSSVSSELPSAPESKSVATGQTPASKAPNVSEFNLIVGTAAQLTSTRTSNMFGEQYIQGNTPSASLLTSFHQQIRPLLGYNVNFGYTKLTENYQAQRGLTNTGLGITTGYYSRGSVPVNMFEITSAFVAKRHQLGHRFEPFAQAGSGVLIFSPTEAPFQGHSSYRATFLFGGGVDYRINRNFGLRAEYRGLFYKYPDFGAVASAIPRSKFFTVTSEPTISFRYRFGTHHGME